MTKIALVDQDHVLAQWLPGMSNILKDICIRENRDFPLPDVQTAWELFTGREEDDKLIKEALNHPELYSSLDPVPGAAEGLVRLEDDLGYKVFICTSPSFKNPTCASQKVEWVAKHLGERWRSRIIMTGDKTLIRGDILIDDKPEVTGEMVPTWEHIVFDAPYNQNSPGRRMCSWDDLEPVLDSDWKHDIIQEWKQARKMTADESNRLLTTKFKELGWL